MGLCPQKLAQIRRIPEDRWKDLQGISAYISNEQKTKYTVELGNIEKLVTGFAIEEQTGEITTRRKIERINRLSPKVMAQREDNEETPKNSPGNRLKRHLVGRATAGNKEEKSRMDGRRQTEA